MTRLQLDLALIELMDQAAACGIADSDREHFSEKDIKSIHKRCLLYKKRILDAILPRKPKKVKGTRTRVRKLGRRKDEPF